MLAFLLVFVAIAAMQFFLPKPKPQPEKTAEQQAQQKQAVQNNEQQQASQAAPVATVTPGKSTSHSAQAAAPRVPLKKGTAPVESVLENEYYRITFTNQGGLVKSWILKSIMTIKVSHLTW